MGREILFGPITFTSRTVSLPTSAGTINGYGIAQTATVHIEPGQTYIVVWGETEWTVTAMDASGLVPGAVAMGNLKVLLLPDTGEPFLIGEIDGTQMILCVDETEPTEHRITVYTETRDAIFEIVLKDRDGVSKVWPATVIRAQTNDGAIRKFVNEESVPVPIEKLDVEADFSKGDIEIKPPPGNVFSKVTIARPAELIPANIPDGMYIAGVGPGEYGATDEEIEEALCVFTNYAYGSLKLTTKNSKAQTVSASTRIPLNSKICIVLGGANSVTQTNTTNLNYPGLSSLGLLGTTKYTTTTSTTEKTITYSRNYTFSAYGSAIAIMVVSFTVPGIKIKPTEGGLVFHCDSNVVDLPRYGNFQSAREVIKVDLLESAITAIPERAFYITSDYGNENLKEVVFPPTLRSIGDYAFSGRRNIAEITIPGTVTSLGNYAFQYCAALTDLVIPSGVLSIGSGCFTGCSSLANLTIPESVQSIDASAFSSCNKLNNVVIPDTVASLGGSTFSSCTSLTDVTLPAGLTTIPTSFFYGCTALYQLTLPSKVKTIGTSAFYGCTSLAQLTLPSGVTSIEAQAFYNCKALAELDCSACTSVPTLANTNAFTNCPSTMQIKVPANLYDSWKAATNWSTYASKIVAV